MSGSVDQLRSQLADGSRNQLLGVGGSVLVLLVLPLVLPSFQVYLLTEFLIISLFAVSFNLLYGYTGLLSFGHGLFYAGGAYGLAIVVGEVGPQLSAAVGGLGPLVTLVVGAIVGVLFVTVLAIPVGYLSVRLEEIYFALITLAFGMAFYTVLLQNPAGLTAGSDGLLVLPDAATIGGIELDLTDRLPFYYVTLAVTGASVYALWRVVTSPFGAVCQALRESSERAQSLGVNVQYHRWATFIVSAFFTGIAGVLVATLTTVAEPALSHWSTSAVPVTAAVIGGASYFIGPIVGAFIYLYARWLLSQNAFFEAYWQLFFGLILVVVVLFFKDGVVGGLQRLRDSDRLRRLLGDQP